MAGARGAKRGVLIVQSMPRRQKRRALSKPGALPCCAMPCRYSPVRRWRPGWSGRVATVPDHGGQIEPGPKYVSAGVGQRHGQRISVLVDESLVALGGEESEGFV